MVGDRARDRGHRGHEPVAGNRTGRMHAHGDRPRRRILRVPWRAQPGQFVRKPRQHVAHGVQRRLEQDQAVRPVGIDHKVGGAMLDMQSLARSEQAGLKTCRQRRVHLRFPCRHG